MKHIHHGQSEFISFYLCQNTIGVVSRMILNEGIGPNTMVLNFNAMVNLKFGVLQCTA